VIEDYIPHRPPFLFVGGILDQVHGKANRCYLDLRPGAYPFMEGGVFPPLLVVEALGQAAAVLMGRRMANSGSGESQLGYLVKLNDFFFDSAAMKGERIILRVRLRRRLGKLVLFHGEARVKERRICSGELTFFVESESNR
jgi:3-hydroxyacyl-[acyl-carrier-protein] dehydratase